MNKLLLLLLLMSSGLVQAQSLKDALFSGKLKNDSGTVIRKGEDLSTKMVTTPRPAPVDSVKVKPVVAIADSSAKVSPAPAPAPAGVVAAEPVKSDSSVSVSSSVTPVVAAPAAVTPAPKDNNALWKDHMNAIIPGLKSEVLPSKKVKKGSYYVLVSYFIETDGQVSIDQVFATPENEFLQNQVKERLSIDAPRLSPVLNSVGTPRKVTKKANFTLVKE